MIAESSSYKRAEFKVFKILTRNNFFDFFKKLIRNYVRF